MFGGLPAVEPSTDGLCIPILTFATPFGFVVWNVSCSYELSVHSVPTSVGNVPSPTRSFQQTPLSALGDEQMIEGLDLEVRS